MGEKFVYVSFELSLTYFCNLDTQGTMVIQSTSYNVKGVRHIQRIHTLMGFQDIMSLPEKPTFILFTLRQEAEEIRHRIKYTCDIVLGILNWCVVCIISAPDLAQV